MTNGSLKPILIGVGGGTVGSVIANQVPQNQHQSHLGDKVKHVKHKAKGKIKKRSYEDFVHSDDPDFNHDAARKVFDLVMKMDDDSASVFTTMAIGEIFETTVEKNLGTLQRHLNEVLAKRLEDTKRAILRTVSKGQIEGSMEMAQAVTEWEEILKANPYTTGAYQFEESDFRRDPNSGRFVLKVKHNQAHPFTNKVADGMGLRPSDENQRKRYGKLPPAAKAQYQEEYRQLSQFLDMVTSSAGAGDHDIYLRLRDKQGNEYRQKHDKGADDAIDTLLKPNLKLVAVEANPNTLTAGGAAFGLANALGAQPGPHTARRIDMSNRAEEGFHDFSTDWNASQGDMKSSNERLYGRVSTAGKYTQNIAPDGSKMYMAGKLATVVGSHGAEAESVIGPTARRTAYRYRGTEKTPDRHLAVLYGRAIAAAKSTGGDPEEELQTPRQIGGRPEGELASRRATRVHPRGGGPGAPAVSQMASSRAAASDRPPTRAELAVGRRVIQDQLRLTLPKGSLYTLQSESGNLPPSEGILINSKGQIATQAVGYGDDHYLPFNLKNLKALKGGEYIRTRSVGGLTSEDIYTGLVTGARRVTVVSRSGTFSVEFEPDFRGGRRYNDKALRMTRRYEQLLDAVQSNKVSSGPIPPQVEQAIRQQVAQDYPYEQSRAAIKSKIKERISEYSEDPDIGPEDEKILNLIYEQGLKDNPTRDASEWMKTARSLVMEGKRFNYQLDAQGYEAAQDSLQEQFPYYIKSIPIIKPDDARPISREKDKGYVEPGRIRPTEPRAGLFGTAANQAQGEEVGDRKFSASQADYQRGRIGPGRGDREPGKANPSRAAREPSADGRSPYTTQTSGAQGSPVGASKARAELVRQNAAVDLFAQIKRVGVTDAQADPHRDVLSHDQGSFARAASNKDEMAKFDALVDSLRTDLDAAVDRQLKDSWLKYKRARDGVNVVEHTPGMELYWGSTPQVFRGLGYDPGDTDDHRAAEVQRIDRRTRSVTTGLPLSRLAADDKGLEREHAALREVQVELQADPTLRSPGNIDGRAKAAERVFGHSHGREASRVFEASDSDLVNMMTDVQRMRTLKANYKGTWPPTGGSNGGASGFLVRRSDPGSGPAPAGRPVQTPDPNDPLAGLENPADLPTAQKVMTRDEILQGARHAKGEIGRKIRAGDATPGDRKAHDAIEDLIQILSARSEIEDPHQLNEIMASELERAPGAEKWVRGEYYYGLT